MSSHVDDFVSKHFPAAKRRGDRWKASCPVPVIQIGRKVRFDIRDLQTWIDEHLFVGRQRAARRS